MIHLGLLYYTSLKGMNIGPAGNIYNGGELHVLKYVRSQLLKTASDERLIIFDVGANIGSYSLAIIDTFSQELSKTDIYIFEPSLITFSELKQIIGSKDLSNSCKLPNLGLSNTVESKSLCFDRKGSDCASLYQQDLSRFSLSPEPLETVNLITLDKFCLDNNISRIHFLKMDIEGHEIRALEGAESCLNSNNPPYFIQFEFGRPNVASRTFLKDFFDILNPKYSIYRVVKDGLYFIPKYSENLELFDTTNYLAKLR